MDYGKNLQGHIHERRQDRFKRHYGNGKSYDMIYMREGKIDLKEIIEYENSRRSYIYERKIDLWNRRKYEK